MAQLDWQLLIAIFSGANGLLMVILFGFLFIERRQVSQPVVTPFATIQNIFSLTEQLNRIENRLLDLQQHNQAVQTRGHDYMYQQASLLIKSGVSLEEVMQSCQLTRAEVELLSRMQSN